MLWVCNVWLYIYHVAYVGGSRLLHFQTEAYFLSTLQMRKMGSKVHCVTMEMTAVT